MWPFSTIKSLQHQVKQLTHLNQILFTNTVEVKHTEDCIELSGSPMHLIAEMLFKQFRDSGATNFLVVGLKNCFDNADYEITMQKLTGETPVQKIRRLEVEKDALMQELMRLKGQSTCSDKS